MFLKQNEPIVIMLRLSSKKERNLDWSRSFFVKSVRKSYLGGGLFALVY